MKPILSAISRFFRNQQLSNRCTRSGQRKALRRLQLEKLEDRRLMTVSVSVADAVLNEIGDVSPFVASGSGGLSGPRDLVLGPDGNVYVVSRGTNSVIRYNGSTGQLLGTFVAAGSGGLSSPYGLAFGPDGNLYVDSDGTNAIYEYRGSTGAFLTTFVSDGAGGLNNPRGMIFGPDGNLYVSSFGTQSVDRFQGPTGPAPGSPLPSAAQSGATFVAAGSGGLAGPRDLIFGPDGNLYMSNGDPAPGATNTNYGVLEFNGTTGSFITTFVGSGASNVIDPVGLAFDQDGRLYVANGPNNEIRRYTSQGQYMDDPVTSSASSLNGPIGMVFNAQGALLVSSRDANAVAQYDRGVVVTLSAASPSPVSVDYATADGTATAGTDYTTQIGTVTFAPGQTSRLILLATLADPVPISNDYFNVELSSPTAGATLSRSQATCRIGNSNAPTTLIVSPADWTTAGLTLTLGGDGNLHVYTTGTTTDAVPPVAPASVSNIEITSPSNTTANLTVDSTNGNPIPPGGLTYSGGGLIITGSGSVTLSGTNSYTGGTTVSAGTLLITAASALPDGTSLTVGAGAAAMIAPPVQPASAAAPAMAASPTPLIGAAVPRIAARLPAPPHVGMSFAMSPAVIDAVFKSHRPAVGPADTSPESAVIRATLPTSPPRFAALAAIESFWSSSDQDKPTGPEATALDKVLARFGV